MPRITFNQILEQLETLEIEELEQLNQTIQKYLANKEGTVKQAAFHQALIDSGLVKQIKHPVYEPITERRLIQIEGKPISETIIEERR
jgi:tetrahydromethanopterin S-methyltransferase subunit A